MKKEVLTKLISRIFLLFRRRKNTLAAKKKTEEIHFRLQTEINSTSRRLFLCERAAVYTL